MSCKLGCASCAAALLLCLVVPADADFILLGQADFSAQGFGNADRLITLQNQGNSTTEVGSVAPVNGTVTGTGDLASPLADNQKFGVPTLSQLGWTNASQVELLFNAVEPGGNSATINSLTLTFYNGNTAIGSISTAQPITIANTMTGNGSAGFLFDVSSSELAGLNSSVFNLSNSGTFRIGISANLADVTGGPDSFNAVAAAPVPSPIAGAGLPGLVFAAGGLLALARRRRSRNQF
jgi:hypothetical protein